MGRDDSYKGIEKDAITYAARTITAGLIKRLAGDRTTSAWYFSMEGNCWLSFNRLAGLSPRSFAALLMAADFVQPRSGQVRKVSMNWSRKSWRYCKDGKWHARLGLTERVTNSDGTDVESYISGDLAFLACILGKEGFEKDWCNWCSNPKRSWQDPDCVCNLWTLDLLEQQVKKNDDDELEGTSRLGVKEIPFFKVKVENIITSVLHCRMGVGNKILNFIVDKAELNVENAPPVLVALRNDVRFAEFNLTQARAARDEWDKDKNGGKLLASAKGKLARANDFLESEDLDEDDFDRIHEAESNIINLTDQIEDLSKQQESNRAKVTAAAGARNAAAKALAEFKKTWKKDGVSVYAKIDKILQKFGVYRSAYHGGEVNGVGVMAIMTNADAFMEDVKEYLCTELNEESCFNEDDVVSLCNDCAEYMKLWDAAFSAVHEHDPSEEHCIYTQQAIDAAMSKHRELEFPVTHKTHCMEKHVVGQMRRVKGGIARMIEHWVEHYHQIGYRYDMKWRNQKSELRKANIRSRREFAASHPETLKRKQRLKEELKTRKRKPNEDKGEAAREERNKKRKAVVLEATHKNTEKQSATEGGSPEATMSANSS